VPAPQGEKKRADLDYSWPAPAHPLAVLPTGRTYF
jgi:hypothetical protein